MFSSSALYSLKGLHIEVKAIAILKKKYPDIKLYVPGGCAENGKIKDPSGYIKYINRLIKKYGLEDNIIFTGSISPSEVAKRLRKANVFVVSSAVEGALHNSCLFQRDFVSLYKSQRNPDRIREIRAAEGVRFIQ